MNKVTTELEALALCKEYQCEIQFRKASNNGRTPEHVIVKFGFNDIIGKDLIEAVNRVVDIYHTAPCNYGELSWWTDNVCFYMDHC